MSNFPSYIYIVRTREKLWEGTRGIKIYLANVLCRELMQLGTTITLTTSSTIGYHGYRHCDLTWDGMPSGLFLGTKTVTMIMS